MNGCKNEKRGRRQGKKGLKNGLNDGRTGQVTERKT